MDLYNSNGTLLASNNNWKDSQEAAIAATGNAPPSDAESALLVTLTPGNYTAIVHGNNGGTGVALFDFFTLQ